MFEKQRAAIEQNPNSKYAKVVKGVGTVATTYAGFWLLQHGLAPTLSNKAVLKGLPASLMGSMGYSRFAKSNDPENQTNADNAGEFLDEQSSISSSTRFTYSPEFAQQRLESLGYSSKEDIDRILSNGAKGSSHEVYALAVLANLPEPKDMNTLYHELYPGEKQAETYSDIQANGAADQAAQEGRWEQFMESTKIRS